MCLIQFAYTMSEDGSVVCEFQNLAHWDIGLVPLEDEKTAVLQYAKTLCKALAYGVLPLRAA